jgi:hypothetical protein
MKKFAILGTLAGAWISLSAGDAGAGITMSAAHCEPVGPNALSGGPDYAAFGRDPNVFMNPQPENVRLICPLPIDHQLGNTVNFRVRMSDQNSDVGKNITCTGYAFNQDGGGGFPASTTMNSGSANPGGGAINQTYTGTVVKTATLSVATQASNHFYSVVCTLPQTMGPAISSLVSVRVF